MDIDKLIERLKYALCKSEVQQLASFFSAIPNGTDILLELSLSKNSQLAFHAAWVLESCLLDSNLLLEAYTDRLVLVIPGVQNNSVRRHLCKIFKTWLVGNQNKLNGWIETRNSEVEGLIEACYGWLLSTDVPVAVRAHCLEILLILSNHYSWIAEELPNTLRLIQIDSTPGVNAMVRRIKKTRAENGKA